MYTDLFEEAQYFSNSYTLKDEYCHCLTSDALLMVSYKCPIIGKQVAVYITGYHSNNVTCYKTPYFEL